MTTFSQRSFAAGEISPSVYGRPDQVKYNTGLATCRNMSVMRHSGVTNRMGGEFIGEVYDSSEAVRLIPFVFNSDQTYVLVFTPLRMMVIKDAVVQVEASKTVTGATQADPCVVTTSAAHGYSNGDVINHSSIAGMSELNGRSLKTANVTATTYELQTMDGVDLDATGFTAYTSGGIAEKVYFITTPYAEADLPNLHYVQSANVITIVNSNYEPRNLTRSGDISWSLDAIDMVPDTTHPTGVSTASGGGGSKTFKYKVTAVDPITSEESLPGVGASAGSITAITQANPAVVTLGAHTLTNGETVLLEGIVGMTELNDRRFVVANKAATTIELKDEDSSAHTAWSSGGTVKSEDSIITSAADPTVANPHVITWTEVSGVTQYNIYRALNDVYGFIGVAGLTTFDDTDLDVDTADTPPSARNPFFASGDYPSTVTYHQQRRIFANTDNDPEVVFPSRIGAFSNFTTRSPLQDDDAFQFNLAGRQVNEVRNLTVLNATLVMLTAGGEWSIRGNSSGTLTPAEPNPTQHSYNGSSNLQPILVNGTALYVQARESIVRDLGFSFEIEGYSGNDLTIFSSHLVEDYTIKDWAYQQIPHSIVWMPRSDGTLLGLTYIREQEVIGWHRHDFYGSVENVVTVPEGTEDALYLVIKSTDSTVGALTDQTVREIIRIPTRRVTDIKDATFLDSYETYDGRNTTTTFTMTLTTGTTWTTDDDLTLTATGHTPFTAADVGNAQIHMTDSSDDVIRLEITGYTSSTVVTVRSHKDVPSAFQGTALSSWGTAKNVMTGLWHLEDKDVSIFGDGFVEASPNNAEYVTNTVSDGAVTLTEFYTVIHVGLPYISDVETLNIDSIQSETLADKKSVVSKVIATVEETRGVWAGVDFPSDDSVDPLEGLNELKVRSNEGGDKPVNLKTDNITINTAGRYNNGRVVLRQVDPVPFTLSAVHPAGLIPFRSS